MLVEFYRLVEETMGLVYDRLSLLFGGDGELEVNELGGISHTMEGALAVGLGERVSDRAEVVVEIGEGAGKLA